MTISIANLKVFAAVARAGSLKDAAEGLGRTTSAVSMSLKQVEDEIGAKLFETERKNRLTAVGQFMLLQVADLLAHYDRTMATLHAYARTTIGRVDIVCVPSVSTMILPMVVSVFRDRYPEVEIDIRDTDSENVVAAVTGGTADLGIGSLTRPRAGLSLEPLFEDALCIICRDDDPLAQMGSITDWKLLHGHVLLTNGICNMITDPDFRKFADRAPIGVYNVMSLIALVKAKVGITLLPRLSVVGLGQDISFIPIELPSARRRVGLLRRMGETGSPAAAAFVDILKDVLKSHRAVFGIELAAS